MPWTWNRLHAVRVPDVVATRRRLDHKKQCSPLCKDITVSRNYDRNLGSWDFVEFESCGRYWRIAQERSMCCRWSNRHKLVARNIEQSAEVWILFVR